MPFEKGHKQSGSRKGIPNKDKRRFKMALFDLFEKKADKIEELLDEVHREHGAKETLAELRGWAEYVFPKLARTESTIEVKDQKDWVEEFKLKKEEFDAEKEKQLH